MIRPRSVSTLVPGCYDCRLRYPSLHLHRTVILKSVHASQMVALPTLGLSLSRTSGIVCGAANSGFPKQQRCSAGTSGFLTDIYYDM